MSDGLGPRFTLPGTSARLEVGDTTLGLLGILCSLILLAGVWKRRVPYTLPVDPDGGEVMAWTASGERVDVTDTDAAPAPPAEGDAE
jgi:hypothetical protein